VGDFRVIPRETPIDKHSKLETNRDDAPRELSQVKPRVCPRNRGYPFSYVFLSLSQQTVGDFLEGNPKRGELVNQRGEIRLEVTEINIDRYIDIDRHRYRDVYIDIDIDI